VERSQAAARAQGRVRSDHGGRPLPSPAQIKCVIARPGPQTSSIINCPSPRQVKEFGLQYAIRAQFTVVLRDSMFLRVRNPLLSRLLVLPWLVTWVLTIPLFHIHALDAQENSFRSQAVLLHTVFSPDLPGEYAPRTVAHQGGMAENQQALSSHFPQYSEYAVGLFNEDNSKRKNAIQPILYAHFVSLRRCPLGSSRYVIPELRPPPFVLLASSVSPRAPPPSVSC